MDSSEPEILSQDEIERMTYLPSTSVACSDDRNLHESGWIVHRMLALAPLLGERQPNWPVFAREMTMRSAVSKIGTATIMQGILCSDKEHHEMSGRAKVTASTADLVTSELVHIE
ncbi:hypothetical protein BLNAU_11381 [Blattamonas nauphoetae]|uniref:Uncharacterized protein n=1 Tax=Blattamonas nauphoetae TaxID=2049346 RepID=A0ABQ9XQB3_9EUKA|nr:hypothetical protein BLNAU_11381 [Blattamonas nauphoetae]